jgi:hypothetical protein
MMLHSVKVTAFVIVFSIHGAGQAAGNPVLEERMSIRAGAFLVEADAEQARYGRRQRPEDLPLDLDLLGIDENDTSLWINGRWRFGERWQTSMGYLTFAQEGQRQAAAVVPAGWRLRPAVGELDSSVQLNLYTVSLDYSLLRSPRADMGVGMGLAVADLEWGLDGRVWGGGQIFSRTREASDALAPLPHLHLFAEYALNPSLTLSLSGGWIEADYDRYDGRMFSAVARLEYRVRPRLGVGLGYQLLQIDLDIDDEGEPGGDRYNVDLEGPLIYVSSGF